MSQCLILLHWSSCYSVHVRFLVSINVCSPLSHQISYDHSRFRHLCAESCHCCESKGTFICERWGENASLDRSSNCPICLEIGLGERHHHFNSRFMWRNAAFCTVCNSGECGIVLGRHKVLFTSSMLGEMPLSLREAR